LLAFIVMELSREQMARGEKAEADETLSASSHHRHTVAPEPAAGRRKGDAHPRPRPVG
jgi:hypothetical protein